MDKLCRVSVDLAAYELQQDKADRDGAVVDALAKDILSDVESGKGDYFDRWIDALWEDVSDDQAMLRDVLSLLYRPARLIDDTGSSHEVAIERLARMRAVFADHQEKWAEREAKQQLEDV